MKVLVRELNQDKMKASYKKAAWFYDLWSLLTESKAAKKAISIAEIKDNQKIIEIACGTGVVFMEIVKRNPNGQNIGIDFSSEMLSKAKKRLKKSKLKNFELRLGDVFNIDIPDDSFDLLMNNFMIDLMPEDSFDTISSKFYRILKPGGIAVISTFSFGEKKINKFWFVIARYFPGLLTGCRPVSISENLIQAGFSIETKLEVSQNTWPSQIIKARK